MTAVSEFIAVPRLQAVHCPSAVLRQAVLRASIELCERAWAWPEVLAPIDVVADQPSYALSSAIDGAKAHTVLRATYDGRPISPVTEDQLDAWIPTGWETLKGTPGAYLLPSRSEIRLFRIPAEGLAGGLSVKIATKPTLASVDVGDVLYDDYLEDITCGALYYLMSMPGQEWTDLSLAGAHRANFSASIANAKANLHTQNSRSQRSVIRRGRV